MESILITLILIALVSLIWFVGYLREPKVIKTRPTLPKRSNEYLVARMSANWNDRKEGKLL